MSAFYGFVCAQDANQITIFDAFNQTHRTIPFQPDLRLATNYCFEEDKTTQVDWYDIRTHFFVMANGEVRVRTWAISPEMNKIPEGLRQKYEGMVWNRHFGCLNDPHGLFRRAYRDGEFGGITVKYAPKNDKIFEIIRIDNPMPVAPLVAYTPWEQEIVTGVPHKALRGSNVQHVADTVNMHHFINYSRQIYDSICIATDVKNYARNPSKRYSPEYCNVFFNTRFGVFRCLRGDVKLGKWYNHFINNKKSRVPEQRGRRSNRAITARWVDNVAAPLKTECLLDRQTVQITTKFTFNHDFLEKKQNRKLSEWGGRAFIPDAHFWDQYLGKVNFDQKTAYFMITKIESHRHQLDSFTANWLKFEPIVITVVCQPRANYISFLDQYPKSGVFEVVDVKKIEYQREQLGTIFQES